MALQQKDLYSEGKQENGEHLDMKTKKKMNAIKLYFVNFDLLQCAHYIAVSRIFVIFSKTVNFR